MVEIRATKALVYANIIIFLTTFSSERITKAAFSLFSFSPQLLHEPWRIISSMFLHAGASHLFFNMVGLYYMGKVIEEEAGGRNVLLAFFASGILGNLLFAVFASGSVVGASGGVFGLMGASMLLAPSKPVRVLFFPLPAGMIAILYGLSGVLMAYYSPVAGGIAHIAHAGGLLAGAVWAFWLSPKKSVKGIALLLAFAAVLFLFAPFFFIVFGIGSAIMGFAEAAAGFILYGAAKALGVVIGFVVG